MEAPRTDKQEITCPDAVMEYSVNGVDSKWYCHDDKVRRREVPPAK